VKSGFALYFLSGCRRSHQPAEHSSDRSTHESQVDNVGHSLLKCLQRMSMQRRSRSLRRLADRNVDSDQLEGHDTSRSSVEAVSACGADQPSINIHSHARRRLSSVPTAAQQTDLIHTGHGASSSGAH
jgi:hypothetical protein